MSDLTIVPIYAAIFGFIYIYLAFRVIGQRRAFRVLIGHGGHARLERIQRVHGNFAEYVPFSLILLMFIEVQGFPAWLVQVLCIALLAARVLHAWTVSQDQEDIRLRRVAMGTTFAVIAIAAGVLLVGGLLRVSHA
jgi:uncharacterized membrane protein YecN with MAPEG domain